MYSMSTPKELIQYFLNLGTDCFNEYNYNKALKCYNKVIALNRRYALNHLYADAYCRIADIQLQIKQYNLALEHYDKAIQINPNEPDFYLYRGTLYRNLGQYNNALKDFNKAINLNPDNDQLATIYFQRGYLYNKQEKHLPAIQNYSKTREFNNPQGIFAGGLRKSSVEKFKGKIFQKDVTKW